MIKVNKLLNGLKIGLATALLAVFTGCVDGGAVVVGPGVGPDVGFFGGFWDRGHDVHAFHDRGFRSRGIAHGGRR